MNINKLIFLQSNFYVRGEYVKLEKLQEDKELVIREEARHQKNISVKQMQLGTFQSEKSQNDEKVGSRNLEMNKLADELKLTGRCCNE